jgi:hypothetical protein
MSFLDELQKQTNKTVTENGAVTNKSTLNPCLDFFAMAGAMRNNQAEATKLFTRAYATDKLTTVRTLFYLRDIRGGQGERSLFRSLLQTLRNLDKPVYDTVRRYIPEYGRWDDLIDADVDDVLLGLVRTQLASDEAAMADNKPVSLLAKWLPSENTSSKATRQKAVQLAKLLELKPAQYRKKVVALRKYIKLLEEQMSAREWEAIDYSKLPSQAQRKHVKAFKRHDEGRYGAYLEAATKSEAKMNTSTLYTYEVFDAVSEGKLEAANAMWANLPDFTQGTNAIVLADVSGSMDGRPMSVSVSLALYFAEHNTGPFHDTFMTFTDHPQVIMVQGNTLAERLRNIENSAWGMSTNLEAALDAILQAGLASDAKGDDMPRVLYVISDMEFNQAVHNPSATIFENAGAKYEAAGLPLPHIVFWNVNARQSQAPATKFDNRVTLISGLSQSTFRYAVEGKTPEELMAEVVNSERYATIEL